MTVLITGASSGIGMALTPLFARDGYELVLVARSEGSLHDLAHELSRDWGVACTVLPADLSEATAPTVIATTLQQASINVDVLVNNAGFATHGPFWETDLADELALLQVNLTGLTHLTKLLLPGMLERKRGRLLNVASTAAFYPGPLMAVYYASKAYVLSFSIALAEELRGSGVTVTALCPGPTRSGFQARAHIEGSRLMRRLMDAETVARTGYQGLMRGQTIVIPGVQNRALSVAARLLPSTLLARLVRRVQEQLTN